MKMKLQECHNDVRSVKSWVELLWAEREESIPCVIDRDDEWKRRGVETWEDEREMEE